jgi:hypothetical protein
MEVLGDVGHVESRFGLFGDSVSVSARQVHGLSQRTIGSKIILDALYELLSDVGHVESRFGPFGDSVSVGAI